MLIGDMKQFTAVDNVGRPRPEATWTIDNTSLATITTNSSPTLTAVAAGTVTLTATVQGVSAQMPVTISSLASFPDGTILWSAPAVTGFSPLDIVQAMPTDFGPDVYSIQTSSDGTQSLVQAFTADGQQMWQNTLPPLGANSLPDGFGGIIGIGICNSTNPLTVMDQDSVTGQQLWQAQISPSSGSGTSCPLGTPKVAIRQDGSVVIANPLQVSPALVILDGPSGISLPTPTIPSSTLTNEFGQSTSCDCFTPVGQPMVDSDGSTYVEYEVREIPSSNPPSSILWLMKIAPDGTTTNTQLSSSSSANLFPGNILPDGLGGVLATWTIANPNPPPAPQPYQGAYVIAGGGITTYALPMAPASLVTGNDGLPINPTLVLGENGTVFGSYGTNITSFNLSTGLANWNYQAPSQTGLSLISYSNGGGLVAKSTTNGTDTVVRFDSGGNATSDDWTGSRVDYDATKALWIGALPSAGLGDFSAQGVDPTPSLSPAPNQERSNTTATISAKLNFQGSKTTGDGLKFIIPTEVGIVECSESLGPMNCAQPTPSPLDRWALNFEGNGKVYDDASKWKVAQFISPVQTSGFYKNIDNVLTPFNCTYPPNANSTSPTSPDGPVSSYLQQTPGQQSIFYIDGPGSTTHVANSNGCAVGFSPIDSMTWWANFKITFTNLPTSYNKTLYFYVKLVVDPGRQFNTTSSIGKYGRLP
jgi:hypothetical protein